MRPQAYKYFLYPGSKASLEEEGVNWSLISYILLCINLFCLTFLSLSILSTRQRIFDFFSDSQEVLPEVTELLLSISSYEYMTLCLFAGFLLVGKERLIQKRFTCAVNVVFLLAIWIFQFVYIRGICLPFG